MARVSIAERVAAQKLRMEGARAALTGAIKEAEMRHQGPSKPVPDIAIKVNRLTKEVEELREQSGEVLRMRDELDKVARKTPEELRFALNSMFDKLNFSPAEELARMCMEKTVRVDEETGRRYEDWKLDPAMRTRILSELNSYVMPKLKSTEISGKVDHEHHITIVRYGADGKVQEERVIGPDVRNKGKVIDGGIVPENPILLPVPRKVRPRATAFKEVDGVFREVEV